MRTSTECRRNPDTEQILEHHQAGSEAAVSGPNFTNSLPATTSQNCDQCKRVQKGEEIHPLTNHIHCHYKGYLIQKHKDDRLTSLPPHYCL